MHIEPPTEEFRKAAERVQFRPEDLIPTGEKGLWVVPIKERPELLSPEAIELWRLFNKPENRSIIARRAESIGRRITFVRGPGFWWLEDTLLEGAPLESPFMVTEEDEVIMAIVLPKLRGLPGRATATPNGPQESDTNVNDKETTPTPSESTTAARCPSPQEQQKTNKANSQQPPTLTKEQKDAATDSIAPITPKERQETQTSNEIAVSAQQAEVMISKVTDGHQSVEPHALGVGYTLEFYEKEGIHRIVGGGIMISVIVNRWKTLVASISEQGQSSPA